MHMHIAIVILCTHPLTSMSDKISIYYSVVDNKKINKCQWLYISIQGHSCRH